MLEPAVGEELSLALANAVLLALWPVLPALAFGVVRQSLTAGRVRPRLSFRPFEAIELDRAVLLHQRVCRRLDEINESGDPPSDFWHALLRRKVHVRPHHIDEFEGLEVHRRYLRTTIRQLKQRPLRRLLAWVHTISSQSAVNAALTTHVTVLAFLIATFHISVQPAAAAELSRAYGVLWYPLDERLFYANAVATFLAALAAPAFYLVRRARLRQECWLEFRALKALANSDPDEAVERPQFGEAAHEANSNANGDDPNWSAVLGLSPSATIEEVKEAYKALIKQNHPDRVHGMSAAFKSLAEIETKRINAAYRQALISAHSL
jgi:DnaJ-like protein